MARTPSCGWRGVRRWCHLPTPDDPAKTGEGPRYGTAREGGRDDGHPVPPQNDDGTR